MPLDYAAIKLDSNYLVQLGAVCGGQVFSDTSIGFLIAD